jgi:hypothetical protein
MKFYGREVPVAAGCWLDGRFIAFSHNDTQLLGFINMSSTKAGDFSGGGVSGRFTAVFQGHLLLWYLFAPAIILICYVYLSVIRANHDVAWLLYVTGRLLDGAQLYQDYLDPSPPFVFYFQIIPVWLARHFDIYEIGLYNVFVGGLIVLSLGCCRQLMNHIAGPQSPILKYVLLLGLAFLFSVLPLGVFGQREHVMAILTFPYILLLTVRGYGATIRTPFAILIGVMAALGMAFKPFFLLLWGLGEAYLFLLRRKISWRRAENIAICLTTAFCGILFLAVKSSYLKILPFILDVYGPLHLSWGTMLKNMPTCLWLLTLAFVLLLKNLPARTICMLRTLCCASTAFFLITFIQRKNWFYHNYPLWVIACFFGGYLVLHYFSLDGEKNPAKKAAKFILIFIVMAASVWIFGVKKIILDHNYPQVADSDATVALFKKYAEDRPIYIMTSNITLPFPTVNESGGNWRVRFHCLWPFWTMYGGRQYPGNTVAYRTLEKMAPNERFVVNSVVKDLLSEPPQLLAVDKTRQPALRMQFFDFLGYFSQDRRFFMLLKNYQYQGGIGHYDIYLINK